MKYWSDEITKRSYEVLIELAKEFKEADQEFILIGGWAAWLWTKAQKSKDIDIILPNIETIDYLKYKYSLKKNPDLKKYEIKKEGVDIDIYVPYFSDLILSIKDLVEYSTRVEGFRVLIPEALLITKVEAYLDRRDSVKGKKDQVDIITLFMESDINFSKLSTILEEHNLKNYKDEIVKLLRDFKEIDMLDLTPREWKLEKERIIDKLIENGS